MTGMFARFSLVVLTSALCCGGIGLYGQSAPPVDERTLLRQELELVKMERENLELRRELLKLQDSAQRGEAAIAHVAELKRQMQALVAARDEAAAKVEQARARESGLEQKIGKLSQELKKARKDFTEQSVGIDILKADLTREREVAEVAMKKLAEEQKSRLAVQQAGKAAEERQRQSEKKFQAELARQSGRIESLEADAARHLREIKSQEATLARQTQRIQSLEAEVERRLQTIKTLEETCAAERLAKASLEAQIAQLTAVKEQNRPEEKKEDPPRGQVAEASSEQVEAQPEEKMVAQPEEKVVAQPEEKVTVPDEEPSRPVDKPAADSLKSMLDELSPDRMFLKAPTGSAPQDKPSAN